MFHHKLAGTMVVLALLPGCQQASRHVSTAVDRTVGSGASTSSLSPADAEFVLRVADGSNAEIALGELAQTNAASAEVKRFGQRMIEEHTRLNQELASLAELRGLSVPKLPSSIDQSVAAALGTRTGAAFDRAYLDEQVAAHQMTLSLFRHAAENADDQALRAFAQSHVRTIQQHINEAQTLARVES
jgi:putative membrane protein